METKRQQRTAAKRFISEVSATAEFLAETAYNGTMIKNEYRSFGENKHKSTEGCSRAMITRNGVAYKLSLSEYNIRTNRKEYMSYWTFPASVRALCTQPYYISKCGKVIAYELVPETFYRSKEWDNDKLEDFNTKLESLLAASGMSKHDAQRVVADNHGNNVGVRENGELVWLDFCPP